MGKRKNSYLLLAVVLIVVSLIVFFLSLLASKQVFEKKEIKVRLVVANFSGIDLNKENISFMLIPGTSQARNLIVENNYGFSIRIFVKSKGNVSRFLSFENTKIMPDETRKIGIIASVPLNEGYNEYNGEIIIRAKKDI